MSAFSGDYRARPQPSPQGSGGARSEIQPSPVTPTRVSLSPAPPARAVRAHTAAARSSRWRSASPARPSRRCPGQQSRDEEASAPARRQWRPIVHPGLVPARHPGPGRCSGKSAAEKGGGNASSAAARPDGRGPARARPGWPRREGADPGEWRRSQADSGDGMANSGEAALRTAPRPLAPEVRAQSWPVVDAPHLRRRNRLQQRASGAKRLRGAHVDAADGHGGGGIDQAEAGAGTRCE